VYTKIRLLDFGRGTGTSEFPDDAEEVKKWFKLCGCDQLGHVLSMEWGGQGYEYNLFPQNANVRI
jgi:hypothetical protein